MQDANLYFNKDLRIFYDFDKVVLFAWNDTLPVKVINKRIALWLYIVMNYSQDKGGVFLNRSGFYGDVASIVDKYSNYLTYDNTGIALDLNKLKALYDRNMSEIEYRVSYPLHVQWIATFKCSHNCIYCGVKKKGPKEYEQRIAFDTIRKRLLEAVDEGTRIFSIHGGDSLFEYGDDVYALIEELVKSKCEVIVSTKSLITNKKASMLKHTGLKQIQLSVDAKEGDIEKMIYGKTRYYENTMKSIKELENVGITTNINIVVSAINKANVISLVKSLINEKNVSSVVLSWYEDTINNARDLGLTIKEKEIIINELEHELSSEKYKEKVICGLDSVFISVSEKPFCANGRFKFMIFPDGSCGVCDFIDDTRFKLGNICNKTIKSIWDSDNYLNLVYIPQKNLEGNCSSCTSYSECIKRGICFNRMLLRNKGHYGPDYICKECF